MLGLRCSMQTSLVGCEGLVVLRHVGSESHDQGLEGVFLTTGPPGKALVCLFFNTSTSLRAHPSQQVFLLIIPTPLLGHPVLVCACVLLWFVLPHYIANCSVYPFLLFWILHFWKQIGLLTLFTQSLAQCLVYWKGCVHVYWVNPLTGGKIPHKVSPYKDELRTVLNVAKSSFIWRYPTCSFNFPIRIFFFTGHMMVNNKWEPGCLGIPGLREPFSMEANQ